MAKRNLIDTKNIHPRTLLLCTYAQGNKIHDMEKYLEEFLNLVKTLGINHDYVLLWKLRLVDASHFLTKGKTQELLEFCKENDIEQVICSSTLTPLQERNISNAINCDVYDRTGLILEIFYNSAHTAEGKTQVEIAELEYLKTRLAGRGKDLAQQAGFIGGRGPGETEKEVLKRYYENKIKQSKKRLETLDRARETQRKRRISSNIPLIALVGYTNSGKSSLLNRLTNSNVLAENKLFSTLDTTTRTLILDNRKMLLSDTVGFISDLPHHLIDAFKSTLDELQYANLILHVVDISDSMWQDQIKIAKEILTELNVKTDILYIFNKRDLVENIEIHKSLLEKYKPYVITETISKEGVKKLIEYIKQYKFN